MKTFRPPWVAWAVIYVFVGGLTVLAESNDDMDTKNKSDNAETQTEFAFNIFSDIAPILALFGEQFATQYLSQSYTWLDHIIFACVPLGIVTALSAAIRVQGSAWMRSFIGRARENRATAEIELMSSTSGEVCEMFNGKAIVRTMGRPKIAQIILFPDEESKSDVTCGIYTLQAAEKEKGKRTKIEREVYRSRWHEFMKPKRRRSSDPESNESDKVSKESIDCLGPPNVQVNVASGHSSEERNKAELFFAMTFAIITQLGVIVIACVTVAYEPTRRAIGFQPESYGLPSYVTGSFAIFVSMLICSHAIERSTLEHIWQRSRDTSNSDKSSKEESLMRLFWIQRAQTVSDQTFGSYIILGGAKRYILTSSRKELVEAEKESSSTPASEKESAGKKNSSDAERLKWEATTLAGVALGATGFVAQFIGLRGLSYPVSVSHLGAIIVMALVRALIRRRLGQVPLCFPALEGRELDCLAYQLTFNKGLREFEDTSTGASVTAEIDSIRQWAVFTPDIPGAAKTRGESQTSTCSQTEIHTKMGKMKREKSQQQDEIPFFTRVISKDCAMHGIDDGKTEFRSQELIRVRKRLGDLCLWKSHETEVALALAQGIESFLHVFLPNGPRRLEDSENSVDWRIRCATPYIGNGWKYTTFDPTDCISVPIRFIKSKWEVEIGQLESILSLWMASIEARRMNRNDFSASRQKRPESDWRRGVRTKTPYCRNLGIGFDDGILMRDISWWIGQDVAKSSKPDAGVHNPALSTEDVKIVIGFNGLEHEEYTRRVDSLPPSRRSELAIFSSNHLPNILAQHLLTSFMWTIVNILPKNALRGTDSTDENEVEVHALAQFTEQTTGADQASYPCKLTHSKLTRVVTSMESAGLATANELLLCMIPALSWKDLLPNERMLHLIPSPSGENEWDRTLKCYTNVLKTSICNGELRKQCLACAIVVKAMDLIFIAHDKSQGDLPFHRMLKSRMSNLIECVLQDGKEILRILAPIYVLQSRWRTFGNIFSEYKKNDLELFTDESLSSLDSRRLMCKLPVLGFSDYHKALLICIGSSRMEGWANMVRRSFGVGVPGNSVEPDLFGWIPLHYVILHSAAAESRRRGHRDYVLRDLAEAVREDNHAWDHRSSRRLCAGPGLVHLAAQAGSARIIRELLMTAKLKPDSLDSLGHLPFSYVETESDRESIADVLLEDWENVELQDERGRTCLHWAVEIATEDSIKRFLKQKNTYRVLEAHDHTGKTPLHIASQRGHLDVLNVLLSHNARVEATDRAGKTALHYAASDEKEDTLKIMKSLVERGANSKSRDVEGRTPLHISILKGKQNSALWLIDEFSADIRQRDRDGATLFMMACQYGLKSIVQKFAKLEGPRNEGEWKNPVLGQSNAGVSTQHEFQRSLGGSSENGLAPYPFNDKDNTGRCCLHYASISEHGFDDILPVILRSGVEIDACDEAGRTPLLHAIRNRKEFNALGLLRSHANPARCDSSKSSPLYEAVNNNCSQVVDYLVENECSTINHVNPRSGRTPLSQACHLGLDTIVVTLLKHPKIDINTPKGANSPLHSSIHAQNLGIAQLILQQPKVDATATDDSGKSPLDVSLSRDSWEIAAELLKNDIIREDGIRLLDQFLSESPKDDGAELEVLLSAMACHFPLAYVNESLHRADSFLEPDSWQGVLDRILERNDAAVPNLGCFLLDAVRCGHKVGVETLIGRNVDPFQLDNDNWSCLSIAGEYGQSEILGYLKEYMEGLKPPETFTRAEPLPPTDLKLPEGLDRPWVKISHAKGDQTSTYGKVQNSDYIFDVKIEVSDEEIREDRPSARTIRSSNCIPPDADNYYFEVEISSGSPSFTVGFCHDFFPGSFDKILGTYPNSVSVTSHGFFLIDRTWRSTSDPPSSNDTFKDGYTVGAGVNMRTGDVYWTQNGVRLNTGETGEISMQVLVDYTIAQANNEANLPSVWASPPEKMPLRLKLKTGKLYPAIGVSAGNGHAKVMLRQTSERRFKYEGPYHYEY